MAQTQQIPFISVAEYFASEAGSAIRHEYVDGRLFARAGASDAHNFIAGNFYNRLRQHLCGSGCRTYMSDMRVHISDINSYYYPDLVVTCAPTQAKTLFIEEPTLIVEVLSPTTETIDRREKLFNYQRIASLREYVLIAQESREVSIYRRAANNQWQGEVISESGVIQLHSLPQPLTISLAEIYEDVPFE